MICPHCGAFFCNDTDEPKTYCSHKCQRNAHHRRKLQRRQQRWKQDVQARSCTGKIAFGSQWQATALLKQFPPEHGELAPMREYRCKFCGKWHLGHVRWISKVGAD